MASSSDSGARLIPSTHMVEAQRAEAINNAKIRANMTNYSTNAFIGVIKGEMLAARLFDSRQPGELDAYDLKSRLHAVGEPWGDTDDEVVLRGRLIARLRLHDDLRLWIK